MFRDKRSRLNLVDVETLEKTSVLNYCTFVQWVPSSDVVVAQSRDNMAVWYNIDAASERVTLVRKNSNFSSGKKILTSKHDCTQNSFFLQLPIKGDIVEIVREDGKTEVVVQEGQHQLSYELDEALIEFGTAIDDGDFNRAVRAFCKRPCNFYILRI